MTTQVDLIHDQHVSRIRFQSENGIHLLSKSVRDELLLRLDDVDQRLETRVVVLESEGRTFLAGADIKELRSADAETAYELSRDGQRLMSRIARMRPITVVAIHAACAGGGCELALACDLRFATDSALIGLPEVSLGLLPGWGGTVRAVRLLGSAVARELILSGRLLKAREALDRGLLTEVFPSDEFSDRLQQRLDELVSRGPQACERVKQLIGDLEGPDIEPQLEAEATAFAACYAQPEPGEGLAAFLEKRAPQWPSRGAGEAPS